MVFDIIPQANTKNDEEENKRKSSSGFESCTQFGTQKMFKKTVTKIMRRKIKKWFRTERENLSPLQFLKDMKVLSNKLEAISRHY